MAGLFASNAGFSAHNMPVDALDCFFIRLAGELDCFFDLEGVPRTLGVRGFFAGVLDGVVFIAMSGAILTTAGGDKDEETPGDAESMFICAGGVTGG